MSARWHALSALALLLVPALAHASSAPGDTLAYKAEPPSGWVEKPLMANTQAMLLRQGDPMAGEASGVRTYASEGRGAFSIAWVTSGHGADESGGTAGLIRRTLDKVRQSASEEVSYQERVVGRLVQADFEWRDHANETSALVRTLMWSTPGGEVNLVRAECVFASDDDRTRKKCGAAVASLQPAATPAERAVMPKLGAPAPVAAAPAGSGEKLELKTPEIGASQDAGGNGVLYHGAPVTERPPQRGRWMLLCGAALVLVALYMTMRKRARTKMEIR